MSRFPINSTTPARVAPAFTLVEVMVSTAILALIVLLLSQVMGSTASIFTRTRAKVDQFRESRAAFGMLTTRLAQATLNTYWDYQYDDPTSPNRIPLKYTRRSELRFIAGPATQLLGTSVKERPTHAVFFQAPFGETETLNSTGGKEYGGFENLLCTWGYYLEYSGDEDLRPPFLPTKTSPPRYRYRLMELRLPAERNKIYNFTSGLGAAKQNYALKSWFDASVNAPGNKDSRVVAENVIAMIITPRLAQAEEVALKAGKGADYSPLAPNYLYDSSPTTTAYPDGRVNPVHQLPPLLQVTLVVIDESSMQRLGLGSVPNDPFGLKRDARFTKTADFSKDLLHDGDTNSLENQLIRRNLGYRIFSTNVTIRGAKWSRQTTN